MALLYLSLALVTIIYLTDAQIGGGKGPIAGGQFQFDLNGQEARRLAWISAGNITAQQVTGEGGRPLVPVRIVSGSQQVVAGTLYRLELILGQAGCTTSAVTAGDFQRIYDCGVASDSTFQRCNVQIWQKPWEHFEQITINSCTPATVNDAIGSS